MAVYIREICESDFKRLAAFLAENAQPRFTEEEYANKFECWWAKNPYLIKTDALGWIIVDDSYAENYIKGFLGNIPVEYRYKGFAIKTANPTTWCIDINYKKHALYLFLYCLNQQKDIVVNATPSLKSKEISLKLGFYNISSAQKTLIKPLSSKIFEHLISKRIKSRTLSYILSMPGYIFLKFFVKVTDILSLRYEKCAAVEVSTGQLIEDLQAAGNNIYIDKIEWILKSDKDKKLFVIYRNSVKEGFVLLHYIKNRVNGLRYLEVLDYLNMPVSLLNCNLNTILKSFGNRHLDFILFPYARDASLDYLRGGFIDITRYMPSICLVYGRKTTDIKEADITGIVGDRGFIFWH